MKTASPARRWWLILVGSILVSSSAFGQTRPVNPASGQLVYGHLANPKALRERLGLTPAYDSVPRSKLDAVRVAVLDYGFAGVIPGEGRYLPKSAVVVEDYDADLVRRHSLGDPAYRKAFESGNRHGRDMAQIVWALSGSHPSGPQFYLLNANGPTMLRRAVRYAIEQRVNIILFSGSFDGGGNGDGRGPINRIVDDAVGRGILWINAAGNYGGHVFDAPLRLLSDGYLRLRDGSDVAAVRFTNRVDENTVTITLTWTDYQATEDAGTDKDLDLLVEDPSGRPVGAGTKVQVSGAVAASVDETSSRNPRERVVLTGLPAFPVLASDPDYAYRIRVRAKTGRFLGTDRIRILVTAATETYVPPGGGYPQEAVSFLDASNRAELYPPADHPSVLTVGDAGLSSSVGPTLDGRIKPDVVVLDSRVDFTDGQISTGSSNAAAELAGVVVVLKAAESALTARHLTTLARLGSKLPTRADRAKLNLPVWQTPTRAKLVEIIRGGSR